MLFIPVYTLFGLFFVADRFGIQSADTLIALHAVALYPGMQIFQRTFAVFKTAIIFFFVISGQLNHDIFQTVLNLCPSDPSAGCFQRFLRPFLRTGRGRR